MPGRHSLLLPVAQPAFGRALRVLAVCAAFVVLSAGCRSGSLLSTMRPVDDDVDIGGIMGPTERRLHAAGWEERRRRLQESGVALEGLQEYDAAQRLYDAGEFRAAEKAFAALARQRARAGKSWQDRWKEVFAREKSAAGTLFGGYGDPIEEDALFMVAECQFAQRKFSWAQDSYGALLEKYPSSRHLDEVTRRLFFIAQTWLGVPPATGKGSDVKLVDHNDAGAPQPALDVDFGVADWPVVPNLFDRTRPVFDTHGRAIQALESIWRHDATGPLADDALMLQATYYHRKGDFLEAARLYKLVREQYPESSHFQDAFLLGSHVTLASYDGPEYDGGTLEESRRLKEASRQLFVNLTDEQKQRLDSELAAIRHAEVEREWAKVEFYRQKNQPTSVALHCNRILHRYPDSEFAARAWDVLQEVRPKLDPESAALFLRDEPPARRRLSEPSAPGSDSSSSAPPANETNASPRRDAWWESPDTPRPFTGAPDFRPIGSEADQSSSDDDPPARIRL